MRQKRRIFNKGEFFALDGRAMFGNKDVTFKDKMVYVAVLSKAKGNEKADESYIKLKDIQDYFQLSHHTVADSSQRLLDAGIALRGFEVKVDKKTNKEKKKWGNTWIIPGRYDVLDKKASKLLIHYDVLRTNKISPRAKMVYFYLCFRAYTKEVNGELQEQANISREMIAKDLGIKDDKNLTDAIDELVAVGLTLRIRTSKITKYGTQVDTSIYTIMELPANLMSDDTNEQEKSSEADNNGEELVSNQINTMDIINDNSDNTTNNSNNLEVNYMSGFLGKFDEVDEFVPTPSYEELGEDVDGFLKDLDPVEEYDEYEEDEEDEEEVMEEVNTVDAFLNDISGTKEEEPVHIPSPAVEKVSVLCKTSDEMVQEANNNVLNYRRNKAPELTKEDKTISMDDIFKMFG